MAMKIGPEIEACKIFGWKNEASKLCDEWSNE